MTGTTRERTCSLAADATGVKALLRAAITAWLDSGGYDGEQLDELLLE